MQTYQYLLNRLFLINLILDNNFQMAASGTYRLLNLQAKILFAWSRTDRVRNTLRAMWNKEKKRHYAEAVEKDARDDRYQIFEFYSVSRS